MMKETQSCARGVKRHLRRRLICDVGSSNWSAAPEPEDYTYSPISSSTPLSDSMQSRTVFGRLRILEHAIRAVQRIIGTAQSPKQESAMETSASKEETGRTLIPADERIFGKLKNRLTQAKANSKLPRRISMFGSDMSVLSEDIDRFERLDAQQRRNYGSFGEWQARAKLAAYTTPTEKESTTSQDQTEDLYGSMGWVPGIVHY